MTKKDFELIAGTIRDLRLADDTIEPPRQISEVHRQFVARRFANDLRATNPLFDRARFLKACGVE